MNLQYFTFVLLIIPIIKSCRIIDIENSSNKITLIKFEMQEQS